MRGVNPGEVWMIDFGMAAKVRPALLLTGEPAADELDLVTVVLHTTALRGNHFSLLTDHFLPGPISQLRKGAWLPRSFTLSTPLGTWRSFTSLILTSSLLPLAAIFRTSHRKKFRLGLRPTNASACESAISFRFAREP